MTEKEYQAHQEKVIGALGRNTDIPPDLVLVKESLDELFRQGGLNFNEYINLIADLENYQGLDNE